jgi:hypothetical protein
MRMSERAPGYSTRASLLVLGITAAAGARVVLALFHDPEGPNLVVVGGIAIVIYAISLAAYLSNIFPSLAGYKRSAAAVVIQLFVATSIFFGLR